MEPKLPETTLATTTCRSGESGRDPADDAKGNMVHRC